MQIAFRTDASLQIGTGHVMRCLTLADTLYAAGAQCTFICRPHAGHLLDLIKHRGHAVAVLPAADNLFTTSDYPVHAQWLGAEWGSDSEQTRQALGRAVVDWLVIDHYALEQRWEGSLRNHALRILVIDDLADRPHDCDLLLDQNLGRTEKDYKGLLSSRTQTLIGPKFALLRPEFAQWRDYSLSRRSSPQLKSLLITMGGVDPDNVTGKVLEALKVCDLPVDLDITVVMGPHAPWLADVKAKAALIPRQTQVLVSVNNMAELMAESDFCIGAAGGSAWERCVVGLPSMILILAANQHSTAMALQMNGAALLVSEMKLLTSQLSSIFSGGEKVDAMLKDLSQSAARQAIGDGASQVAEILLNPYV
jgi:UDP-2,4-diacetamido-2,4,6-trideoxy-beta-L-altropyranose hydrolase